jgi:hypothetical protein
MSHSTMTSRIRGVGEYCILSCNGFHRILPQVGFTGLKVEDINVEIARSRLFGFLGLIRSKEIACQAK